METRAAKRRRLLYGSMGSRWSMPSSPEPPVSRSSKTAAAAQANAAAAAAAAAAAEAEPRFTLFGRLPAELRLEIWRLVEEQVRQPLHPLRVRLYRGYERVQRAPAPPGGPAGSSSSGSSGSSGSGGRSKSKRKQPAYTTRLVPRLTAMPDLGPATQARRALLRVCREARFEYLRRWSATLDLDRGGLVRFDAARDLVYLDIANRALMDDLALLHATNPAALPPFVHAIRHLGLEMTPHLPQWLLMARDHMMPRLEFLLSFPALRSLSLVNFGCFAGEVTWGMADEARLLLARSAGHRVYFRSFAVLPGFNYAAHQTPRVGRQTSLGAHTRHDCAICSIHRCVFVREMLRSHLQHHDDDDDNGGDDGDGGDDDDGGGGGNATGGAAAAAAATTTEAERRWLGSLKFHTLLAAATPEVERHVQRLDPASLETGSEKTAGADKHGGGGGSGGAGGHHHHGGGGGGGGHGHNDDDDDDDDDGEEDDEMLWEDEEDDDEFDAFTGGQLIFD